jgi:type I restriction enzyme R subunit
MPVANQNPEQLVRDRIDKMLLASGWVVQSKKQINLAAGNGVAIREYHTDIGPADNILFVIKSLLVLLKPSVKKKVFALPCTKTRQT